MKSEQSANETIVSMTANPSMPASWTGSNKGESWDCGDYYLVLQKDPCMAIVKLLGGKLPPQLKEAAKRIRYYYALFVYYKPGKNPTGKESVQPCLVLTMESVLGFAGWDGPQFCVFTPTGRINRGNCYGGESASVAKNEFFGYLKSEISGTPVPIGNMMEVHRRLNPEAHEAMMARQRKSGCLVFLAIPLLTHCLLKFL